MIKVSVIVPVYNVQEYLGKCLSSLTAQTLKDIEIICVDDGSTDDSLAILKRFAKKDKRVKILTQNNQYAGVARNAGLKVAKGEFLSFLDADDFLKRICWKKCITTPRIMRRILLYAGIVNIIKTLVRIRWCTI